MRLRGGFCVLDTRFFFVVSLCGRIKCKPAPHLMALTVAAVVTRIIHNCSIVYVCLYGGLVARRPIVCSFAHNATHGTPMPSYSCCMSMMMASLSLLAYSRHFQNTYVCVHIHSIYLSTQKCSLQDKITTNAFVVHNEHARARTFCVAPSAGRDAGWLRLLLHICTYVHINP